MLYQYSRHKRHNCDTKKPIYYISGWHILHKSLRFSLKTKDKQDTNVDALWLIDKQRLWQGGSRSAEEHKEACMLGACRAEGHERRGLQGQREESAFYSECSEEHQRG